MATTPIDDLEVANDAVEKRLVRLTRPVRRLVNQPYLLVCAILTIWVGCAAAYAIAEKKGPIEALWWGIVTGSTVGYGDYYPETTIGRGIATVLIVSMLILIPIAIGHVIANLVSDRNQFTHAEQVALAATVESIHDRTDLVEKLLIASLTERHGPDWVATQIKQIRAAEESGHDVDDHMLTLFNIAEE